jgi:hypothetical protein
MYLMHSCVYVVCVCESKAVGVVRQRDVAGNFAPDVTAYYSAVSYAQR